MTVVFTDKPTPLQAKEIEWDLRNGRIEIKSIVGGGTTFSISLPLTLAILDGMSVRVGEEIYIMPLTYITESLQAQAEVDVLATFRPRPLPPP
mgnify:CR=1 FL=1